MKAIVHTLIVMKRYASVSRSLLLINRSLLLINRSLFTHVDRDEKVRSYAAPRSKYTHTNIHTQTHHTHTAPNKDPKNKNKSKQNPCAPEHKSAQQGPPKIII